METQIVVWIIGSIGSAILYRAGGLDKTTEHWLPVWMRHSWVRDWICPLFVLLPFFLVVQSWWFVLSYLCLGGSLSTYWDWLFKKDCFWFSGFMCGMALFPLIFCGVFWWIIVLKAILLGIAWGLLCSISDNDFVEEYGRGSFLVLF